MSPAANKIIAGIFFISSGVMLILGFTTYNKIASAYSSMPESVKLSAKMQNFPLEEIFSALKTSGFGLFFIGSTVLFGFGWIVLNFALPKKQQQIT